MISLEAVGFSYGSGDIFSQMTVEMAPGSFHFLTGPSGAGKTTFLRLCYSGLIPTVGEARIFGNPTKDMDRDGVATVRRRIGVVHQNCQFLDHLSVEENVALPLMVSRRDLTGHREQLEDLMSWVGLAHRASAMPPELSGGERQRAALARAVMLGPDMIIADEPTGNIDWDMAQRVLRLLTELNKMGKTILVATHDLNLIRAAGKEVPARVLRLKDGRLLVAGADV